MSDEREGGAGSPVERRVLLLLLGAVLAAFTGQQLLVPVLAPLSRELRLGEVQLGFVITSAAVVFTLASLFWGRVCDRWGHRRVLLTGLVLCTAGLGGFAAVAAWAMSSETPPAAAVLTGMIVMRSVLFGFGVGAVPVAALAYVGAGTAGETERTRAVSLVGAAQAFALVLGPGVGGLLAAGTLLGPLYLAPVVLGLITVVVAVVLPRAPRSAAPRSAARRPGRSARSTRGCGGSSRSGSCSSSRSARSRWCWGSCSRIASGWAPRPRRPRRVAPGSPPGWSSSRCRAGSYPG